MRRLIALLAAVAAAGCGALRSGPRVSGTPHDYYVTARPDQAWAALTEVYTDLNVPVRLIDKASAVIQSEQLGAAGGGRALGRRNEDLFDCGKGAIKETAGQDSIEFRISTLLKPAGDTGTFVRTSVTASAIDNDRSRRRCASKGMIEGMIAENIERKVGGR